MVKWYRLRDWFLGPFVAVSTNSEIIDFILYADWFSHRHHQRIHDMRQIQQMSVVEIAPTRLGVLVNVIEGRRQKRKRQIFIQLFDHRVMTLDLFRIRTYRQTFSNWLKLFPASDY